MILPGLGDAMAAREETLRRCRQSLASGDRALYGPDSMSWHIVGHFAYGISALAALLLEALHPVAMAAIDRHSDYRHDPWRRACRTAAYVFMTTFGSRTDAFSIAAHVRQVHQRIEGEDVVTGRRYRADDPDLLLWIHCVGTEMALRGHERYVETLAGGRADLFVAEQVEAACLVGLPRATAPRDRQKVETVIADIDLRLTGPAAEFARMLLGAAMPVSMRLPWAMHVIGAIALLPPKARELYAFPRWSMRGRLCQAAVGGVARLADRRFGARTLLRDESRPVCMR